MNNNDERDYEEERVNQAMAYEEARSEQEAYQAELEREVRRVLMNEKTTVPAEGKAPHEILRELGITARPSMNSGKEGMVYINLEGHISPEQWETIRAFLYGVKDQPYDVHCAHIHYRF